MYTKAQGYIWVIEQARASVSFEFETLQNIKGSLLPLEEEEETHTEKVFPLSIFENGNSSRKKKTRGYYLNSCKIKTGCKEPKAILLSSSQIHGLHIRLNILGKQSNRGSGGDYQAFGT